MNTDFEHLYDVARTAMISIEQQYQNEIDELNGEIDELNGTVTELRRQLAAQHRYIAELERQLEPGVVDQIREELGQAGGFI